MLLELKFVLKATIVECQQQNTDYAHTSNTKVLKVLDSKSFIISALIKFDR